MVGKWLRLHALEAVGATDLQRLENAWRAFIAAAKHTVGHVNQKQSGKLANRKYVRVNLEGKGGAYRASMTSRLPPQARTCLAIFHSEGTEEVPEARLKELIEKSADSLRTKQNPWRIFQYYRAQLISLRWMRMT